MNFVFNLFVFVFGLCIGSFLNCVIYRLEKKKTLKGRSFCPHCKHTLGWQDLFPVFSFIWLKGKCRYCKKKISWQYPALEIATAVIFLLIFSAQGGPASGWNFLNLIFLFYISSVLIIIFIYDLKHYIIPDKVLFPAILIALIFNFSCHSGIPPSGTIFNYLLAALLASGFFFAIWAVSGGKWMGFGDVKLAILLGLLLGLPNILVALFLAFFFGAIIGLIMMAFKKKGLKSEVPFGPFLVFGTLVALLWGSQITQWYLQMVTI